MINASNRITSVLGKLLMMLMLSALSVAALAHTGLTASNPANGAIIQKSPEQLALTFTGEVALVKLAITDAAGKQVKLDFKPSTETQKEYLLAMPQLSTGQYEVEWAAIGADGHSVPGTFGFAVDPAATPAHGHGASSEGGSHGH